MCEDGRCIDKFEENCDDVFHVSGRVCNGTAESVGSTLKSLHDYLRCIYS